MHRYLKARLLASALVLAAVPTVTATTPSQAAVSISIGFNYFHDNLSNYGDWVYSSRWGRVWRPDVDADFRPYTRGHWVDTDDYGWLWVSDEPFGDITYHYGRWVNDPYDGWLWIPGYVWGPAWVVWRSGSNYTGWMPMPPTEAFLEGDETSYDISDDYDYGYRRWYPDYSDRNYASLWIFVGNRYIGDRDYRRYAVRRPRVTNIIRSTRNVTNYTVVNNYVVNRSVNLDVVRRAGGRVERVRAASVIKHPDLIMRADRGREIQVRMRKEAPHGTGRPDSAPKPTAEQIQTLSPTIRTRGNGKKPTNLLTRTKAQELVPNANAPEKNTGKPPEAAPPGTANPQTPAEQMRERRNRGRDENRPGTTNPQTPNPQTPNSQTPAEQMRDRRRGREGEPANAATPNAAMPEQKKPAEVAPPPNKPAENGNAPEDRRNNSMRELNRVPNDRAMPEKPATETLRPERMQRPMEGMQPKVNEAPTPPKPKPEAAPAQPDRSQMRDEMRQRMQDRARENAQPSAPQPPREQAPAAPQREQMQERMQQMRERAQPATPPAAAPATSAPRQIQRERPVEQRGTREKEKDEDKNKNEDKNKKPD